MDTSLPLFDPQRYTPIARNDNPSTSHESASILTGSGARAKMMRTALAMVVARPGLTGSEYDRIYDGQCDGYVPHGAISKRLPDLREQGYLQNGPKRKSPVTMKNGITWLLAERAKE